MYTADAEVDVSRLLPDESVMRGRDQIRAYYDRMWETWSGFGWEPCEMAELGEGKYAVLVRLDAEGTRKRDSRHLRAHCLLRAGRRPYRAGGIRARTVSSAPGIGRFAVMARCGLLFATTAVILAVAAPIAMAGQFASQSFGLAGTPGSGNLPGHANAFPRDGFGEPVQ